MLHDDAEIRALVRRLAAALTDPRRAAAALPGGAQLLDIEVDGVRCRCTLVDAAASEGDTCVALSPREREVARMVAGGHTNQAIADLLGISAWTVSTHLRRIFGKLGVNSRAAMVARILNAGGEAPPDDRRPAPAEEPTRVRATHIPVSREDATAAPLPGTVP
ncbi:LuxR C-terminal-related transcriptional regulator [Actinoplanes sp. NPDC049316]|uniref:response regulator transcription factor n=1 Tax=Actinoplanes sp. NPDC049316 TaxID=3154727 RepID=UPI0034325173